MIMCGDNPEQAVGGQAIAYSSAARQRLANLFSLLSKLAV